MHCDGEHLPANISWINLSIFENRESVNRIIVTFSMDLTVYSLIFDSRTVSLSSLNFNVPYAVSTLWFVWSSNARVFVPSVG